MSFGVGASTNTESLGLLEVPEKNRLPKGLDLATCLVRSWYDTGSHFPDVMSYPGLAKEFTKASFTNHMLQPLGMQKNIRKIPTKTGENIVTHTLASGTGKGGALIVNLHGLVAEELQNWKVHKQAEETWTGKTYDMLSIRQHNTSWSGEKDANIETVAAYIVAGIEHTLTPQHTQLVLQGNSAGGIPIPLIVKEIHEKHPHLQGKIQVIMSAVPMGGEYGNDEGVFNQFLETHINSVKGIGLEGIRKKNKELAKKIRKDEKSNYQGFSIPSFMQLISKETNVDFMKKIFVYTDELLGLYAEYISFLLDNDREQMHTFQSKINTTYAEINAALNIIQGTTKPDTEGHSNLRFNGWEDLHKHILAKRMPEESKKKIKATFINMLFSRNGNGQVEEQHKDLMVDNGHDLFFQDAVAYKWLKDMAHETSRTDLPKMYQEMVETIGAENVLVVVGEDDVICDKQKAQTFWMSIDPAIQVEILAGCGHVPQLETPEQLVDLMEIFIFNRTSG